MSQYNDLLYTITGVSGSQLTTILNTVIHKGRQFEGDFIEQLTHHPPESLMGFTFSAATAFYLVEGETNPQINSLVDALYYISTCLTVGYADVFPVTPQGRFIATIVMTFGPALTNNALDPPGREKPSTARSQQAIIERLDKMLIYLAEEDRNT